MKATRSAAFVGNMNAMPMTYALQLRDLGWDVTFFVDTPPSDKLSRPELKFSRIDYPYPSWIIERPVRNQVLAALMPRVFLADVIAILRQVDVVFLSGFYLCLMTYLRPWQKVLFLSHGSDLDVWCDSEGTGRLADVFAKRVGRLLSRMLVNVIVRRMISALRQVSAVITFPEGLSVVGERVLAREVAHLKVRRISRYDISLFDLPLPREPRRAPPSDTLKIICGTRHTFNIRPGLTADENKGTNVIIKALARYVSLKRRPIEVHFFEKGLDVLEAKELCQSNGIARYVVWHPETPFQDFLKLHETCHIAFDQVGCHWVGTGMYAMYLSMPVIANSRKEVLENFWGEASPICHAVDQDSIVRWLITLEDAEARRSIGDRSHRFAVTHFDAARTAHCIVSFIEESYGRSADRTQLSKTLSHQST